MSTDVPISSGLFIRDPSLAAQKPVQLIRLAQPTPLSLSDCLSGFFVGLQSMPSLITKHGLFLRGYSLLKLANF